MSKSEVSAPVSSAASDRLALGVGWVRPVWPVSAAAPQVLSLTGGLVVVA